MSARQPQDEIHIIGHVPQQGDTGAIFELSLNAQEALQLLDLQREFMRTRKVLKAYDIAQETQLQVQMGHFWKIPAEMPLDPQEEEHQELLSSWTQEIASRPEGRRWTPARPELLNSFSLLTDDGTGKPVQAEKVTITNDPSFFFNYADPHRGYMPPALLIHRSELLRLSMYVLDDEEIEQLLPELAAIGPDQLLEWLKEGFHLLGQPSAQQRPLPKISSATRAKLLKHARPTGREKLIRALPQLTSQKKGPRQQ